MGLNNLLDGVQGGWSLNFDRGNAIDVMGIGGQIPLNKFPFSHVIGQTASITGFFTGGLAKAFGTDIGNRMDYDDSSAQDFAAGDNSFTVMAWVQAIRSQNAPFLAKWPSDNVNDSWRFWNRSTVESYRFSINSTGVGGDAGPNGAFVDIANPNTTTTGGFELIVAGYDAPAEEIWISRNASAKVRVAHTGGAFAGGNSRLGLGWFGSISGGHDQDECAYWTRQLSDADITNLWASGAGLRMALWDATVPVEDGSLIKQDMVSYWDMTDASGGDRIDVHAGSNNTSEAGAGAPIDQGVGLLGVEKSVAHADMTSNPTSPEFLEKTSPVGIDQGDGSFTVAGWVEFLGNAGQRQNAIGRWTNVGDQEQFMLTSTAPPNTVWQFAISTDGTPASGFGVTGADDVINESGVPVMQRFLVAWYDGALDTINVQSMLGVVNTVGGVSTVFAGSTESLKFGQTFNFGANWRLQGGVWSWGYWKRVLTEAERIYLYKRGSGRLYAEFAGPNGAAQEDHSYHYYWSKRRARERVLI